MTKTFIFFALLLLSFSCLQAQDFDNYTPLKSAGNIPVNLITSSTQKYEEDKANTASNQKKERQFYLKSNFVLDELLRSGQLLFNDPISAYVEKILAVLLKDEEKLQQELSVYTVKSASVNAFATDRGEIFVNVGLIAKLGNEAQLAFILCHEIQHYLEKHNLDLFVYEGKVEKGEEVFKSEKSYDKVLDKHSYNRDLEREADELGYKLFKKAGYSLEDALGVFEILSLTHTPYQNEVFTFDWLELGNIKIDQSLYLEKVDSIKTKDNEDESLSTHPSVAEREGRLREWLEVDKGIKGLQFIVSEQEFSNVRKTARFEICDILVRHRSYSAAIYHSYLLLKKYPTNQYLKSCVAKSLYGLAQYKNDDRLNKVYYKHDKIQGEMQRAFYLFENLNKENLNAIAIRYCWELFQEYPNDQYIKYSTRDLVEDLVIYGVEDIDAYHDKMAVSNETMVDSSISVDTLSISSVDTLSSSENKEKNISQFVLNILDIWSDSTFQSYIESGKRYKSKFAEKTQKSSEENRRERLKGKSLGIDNVVFINPSYLQVNLRKGRIDYQYSEERQAEIRGYIEENATKLDLKASVLDMNNLNDTMTASDYNEIAAINAWTNELLNHNMYMICSNYNEVLPLTEKYNSNYFAYTGVYSAKGNSLFSLEGNLAERVIRYFKVMAILATSTSVPSISIFLAPVEVFNIVTSTKSSFYYTAVLDFNTHSIVLGEANIMKANNKPANIKSNLYWVMQQMKRSKK